MTHHQCWAHQYLSNVLLIQPTHISRHLVPSGGKSPMFGPPAPCQRTTTYKPHSHPQPPPPPQQQQPPLPQPQRNKQVEAADENGTTPLMFACRGGHAAVALALLREGAETCATTSKGSTPLHFAASAGCSPVGGVFCWGGRGDDTSFCNFIVVTW